MTTALFNRRMRKTARPVVWEPWRAKSRQGHPPSSPAQAHEEIAAVHGVADAGEELVDDSG